MRNNCINKNFYSRPYKCGVLPHLTQPSFATLLFISAAIEASNLKFVLNLCSESSMPKTTFRTKFGRGLSQRSIAKIVGPLLISTTVERSNLKFWYTTLVRGVACQKQLLEPELAGVGAREHPQKFRDPLHICGTIEAKDFKFGK